MEIEIENCSTSTWKCVYEERVKFTVKTVMRVWWFGRLNFGTFCQYCWWIYSTGRRFSFPFRYPMDTQTFTRSLYNLLKCLYGTYLWVVYGFFLSQSLLNISMKNLDREFTLGIDSKLIYRLKHVHISAIRSFGKICRNICTFSASHFTIQRITEFSKYCSCFSKFIFH